MNNIFNYFDELFPNPKCELNYNSGFELLIAIVLSAQTTDKKVNLVTKELFMNYDINSLQNAKIEDLNAILKPIGMSRKKSIYIRNISRDIINKYNGIIPRKKEELLKLDGVGNKTANLILSTLYEEPYFAVDTHVERVTKRLGLVKKDDDVIKIENTMYKLIPRERLLKTHHQFVLFGRYYCKSIKPLCSNCKLKSICKKDTMN